METRLPTNSFPAHDQTLEALSSDTLEAQQNNLCYNVYSVQSSQIVFAVVAVAILLPSDNSMLNNIQSVIDIMNAMPPLQASGA